MIKMADIESFVEELRPALQSDGGDMELISLEDGILKIRFLGACSNCMISDVTLTRYISEQLVEKFPDIKEIVPVD